MVWFADEMTYTQAQFYTPQIADPNGLDYVFQLQVHHQLKIQVQQSNMIQPELYISRKKIGNFLPLTFCYVLRFVLKQTDP